MSITGTFQKDRADRVCHFFERYLTHTRGDFAGQPFTLLQWQREPLRQFFGTVREDETLLYRKMFIEIGRGNGKSTLAAGMGLYGLLGMAIDGPQVIICAGSQEQARIIFDECAAMLRAMIAKWPELEGQVKILKDKIKVPGTNGELKTISKSGRTAHGLNPSMIVFDELHVQQDASLWEAMISSMRKRKQCLLIALTTAGHDVSSICYEVHDYATKVRDGVIEDPEFLPVIHSAEGIDDWWSDKAIIKANPSIGHSLRLEDLRRDAERARKFASQESTFKRLHLSLWSESQAKWIGLDDWRATKTDLPIEHFKGQSPIVGMDLAEVSDLSAIVFCFDKDDCTYAYPYFFIPRDTAVSRGEGDKFSYLTAIKKGEAIETLGNVTDFDAIRDFILQMHKDYPIAELVYDKRFAERLVPDLVAEGITDVPIKQEWQYISPYNKGLERAIKGRTLKVFANSVMDWNASNVEAEVNNYGEMRLRKPKGVRQTRRIDGIVALAMAVGRKNIKGVGAKVSVYDKGEGLFL